MIFRSTTTTTKKAKLIEVFLSFHIILDRIIFIFELVEYFSTGTIANRIFQFFGRRNYIKNKELSDRIKCQN